MQALTIEERLERIREEVGRSGKLPEDRKVQIRPDSGIRGELCNQSMTPQVYWDAWENWSNRR
jgi:hypothetical protein